MARNIPVLVFDWADENIRQIASNIYHAQKANYPAKLTYDCEKTRVDIKKSRAAKRYTNNRVTLDDVAGVPGMEWLVADILRNGAFEVPTGSRPGQKMQRDEYPFACTKEHEGKVWVGNVDAAQNSLQGGMIRKFLHSHGATNGFEFEVKVINHPKTD